MLPQSAARGAHLARSGFDGRRPAADSFLDSSGSQVEENWDLDKILNMKGHQ